MVLAAVSDRHALRLAGAPVAHHCGIRGVSPGRGLAYFQLSFYDNEDEVRPAGRIWASSYSKSQIASLGNLDFKVSHLDLNYFCRMSHFLGPFCEPFWGQTNYVNLAMSLAWVGF